MTRRSPLLRSQAGMALPVAILVLGLTLAISTYAFTSATRSNGQSNADRQVKLSLQAADAGLQTAIYRLNKLDAARSPQPCVTVAGGSTVNQLAYAGYDPAAPGWCPEVSETLADGGSWSYRVSAAEGGATIRRTIVATGRVGATDRRVATTVTATNDATPLFGGYALSSIEGLSLANNVQITGSVRSGGNIALTGGAKICGNVTPGPGKQVTTANGASVCPGYTTTPATSAFSLPPVAQGTAATDNSNSRICAADPCTNHTFGNGAYSWNPTARTLRLAQNATLSLGGTKPYSFCRLELDNSAQIIVPAGQTVKIFIDSPENCGGSGGTLSKLNSSQFVNLAQDPSALQIYVAGSPTIPTPVNYDNFTDQWLTLYAPQSEVFLRNYFRMNGAVAGKRVVLDNGAQIIAHPATANVTGAGVFPLFRSDTYRECLDVAGSTAFDRGCAVDPTG